MFFKSEDVKIFPCYNRGVDYNKEARLATEYNFTHLPGLFMGYDSYIIESKGDSEPKLFRCVIHGYYFEFTGDAADILTKDAADGELQISAFSYSEADGQTFLSSLSEDNRDSIDVKAKEGSTTYYCTAVWYTGKSEDQAGLTCKNTVTNSLDITDPYRKVAPYTYKYKEGDVEKTATVNSLQLIEDIRKLTTSGVEAEQKAREAADKRLYGSNDIPEDNTIITITGLDGRLDVLEGDGDGSIKKAVSTAVNTINAKDQEQDTEIGKKLDKTTYETYIADKSMSDTDLQRCAQGIADVVGAAAITAATANTEAKIDELVTRGQVSINTAAIAMLQETLGTSTPGGSADGLTGKVYANAGRITNLENTIGTLPTDYTTVVAGIADAKQAADDVNDRINELLTEGGQIEKNRQAIAQNVTDIEDLAGKVSTLVGTDTNKSVRTIAAEETAKIVADADTKYDTLKEIADFIMGDETGAAAMANDIDNLKKEFADGGRVDDLEDEFVEGGRVTQAETDIDAVEGRAAKLEAIVAGYAATNDDPYKTVRAHVDAINESLSEAIGAASTEKAEATGVYVAIEANAKAIEALQDLNSDQAVFFEGAYLSQTGEVGTDVNTLRKIQDLLLSCAQPLITYVYHNGEDLRIVTKRGYSPSTITAIFGEDDFNDDNWYWAFNSASGDQLKVDETITGDSVLFAVRKNEGDGETEPEA